MKLQFQGEVSESGKLKIFKRIAFLNELHLFAGKKVVISIERKYKKRSVDQNNYYWGVVIPEVRKGLIDMGWKVDTDETHDLLKDKFLEIDLINENTGEVLKSKGSSRKLTTIEFMEYIEDIQQFSAEFLNVVIPDPGQQLEIPN